MQNVFAGTTNFNKKKCVKLSQEPKAAHNPEREGGRERARERERERERDEIISREKRLH